jgi:dihydrodipicolinate synthase/N-acetylneuraminate lyase
MKSLNEYINESLFVETNPIPIKTLLNELKIISSSELRLPLVDMSTNNKKMILDLSDEISHSL